MRRESDTREGKHVDDVFARRVLLTERGREARQIRCKNRYEEDPPALAAGCCCHAAVLGGLKIPGFKAF